MDCHGRVFAIKLAAVVGGSIAAMYAIDASTKGVLIGFMANHIAKGAKGTGAFEQRRAASAAEARSAGGSHGSSRRGTGADHELLNMFSPTSLSADLSPEKRLEAVQLGARPEQDPFGDLQREYASRFSSVPPSLGPSDMDDAEVMSEPVKKASGLGKVWNKLKGKKSRGKKRASESERGPKGDAEQEDKEERGAADAPSSSKNTAAPARSSRYRSPGREMALAMAMGERKKEARKDSAKPPISLPLMLDGANDSSGRSTTPPDNKSSDSEEFLNRLRADHAEMLESPPQVMRVQREFGRNAGAPYSYEGQQSGISRASILLNPEELRALVPFADFVEDGDTSLSSMDSFSDEHEPARPPTPYATRT